MTYIDARDSCFSKQRFHGLDACSILVKGKNFAETEQNNAAGGSYIMNALNIRSLFIIDMDGYKELEFDHTPCYEERLLHGMSCCPGQRNNQ